MTYEPGAALRALHDADVRYVLTGSLAGVLHGSPVLTDEVELCHDADPANVERLATVLAAMGTAEVPALPELRRDRVEVTTDHGRIATDPRPHGTHGYADLIAAAERMDVGGFAVDVAALDDVLRVMRATYRQRDRVEVETLLALRDEITESS